jgi:hypothetical protein
VSKLFVDIDWSWVVIITELVVYLTFIFAKAKLNGGSDTRVDASCACN